MCRGRGWRFRQHPWAEISALQRRFEKAAKERAPAPATTTVIVQGEGAAATGRSTTLGRIGQGIYRRVSYVFGEVLSIAGTGVVILYMYLVVSRVTGGFHHAFQGGALGPALGWAAVEIITTVRRYV